jgi:multidrug efflux pump subunit AcrA (membrane-fusion protein)
MSIKSFVKSHTALVATVAIIAVVLMSVAGRMANKKTAEVSKSNTKQVSLIEARTFRDDLTTVSVEGVIESASQVDIKSQVSAPISQVYVSVGDSVAAGQTIVEFQNADIRAQLEQAKANLAIVKGQYTTGAVSGDAARNSAVNSLRENYIRVDDAINTQIAQFLYTKNASQPQLQQSITDRKIAEDLSSEWMYTDHALELWKNALDSISATSTKEQIQNAFQTAQDSIVVISKFMDTLTQALNNRTENAQPEDLATIGAWRNVVIGARATVNGAMTALTNAGIALNSSDSQISVAEAGVKGLQAQLAKTIITSPISGKIAALPSRVGEFVGMGQLITTVVGSGGLELKAYASSEDVDRIRKGAPVTVQGSIPGIVTNISPSVNQANKKVEVIINIPSVERANLVVGQNVQAKIEATPVAVTKAKEPVYLLPIQNVKIVPGQAFVFTTDENSKLVKHEVKIGEVKGDFVEVKTGITDDMKIVSPVYELEEGETVRTE